MSMSIITADGKEKRRCVWCEKLKHGTYCTDQSRRKTNRHYLCFECDTDILHDVIDDYVRQIRDGVPKERMMVLFPMRTGPCERLHLRIQGAIEAIEINRQVFEPHPALVVSCKA